MQFGYNCTQKWLNCTRLRLVQLPSHFLVQLDIRTRNKLLVTEHGPWQLPALNVEQLLGTLVHPYGKPFVTFTSQERRPPSLAAYVDVCCITLNVTLMYGNALRHVLVVQSHMRMINPWLMREVGRSLTSCIGENGTHNHLPHAKAFGNYNHIALVITYTN